MTSRKFLFLTHPGDGHYDPIAPIVSRLCSRKHQVVWITGRSYRERVESLGARFYPMSIRYDHQNQPLYEFFPRLKEVQGIRQLKYFAKHLFIDQCPEQFAVIDQVLETFKADAIVGDTTAIAAYYKAEKEGIRCAMVNALPLGLRSIDTAPPGLGLPPGDSLFHRVRNRTLDYLINRVVFRDVTRYANTIRKKLDLPPLTTDFLVSAFTYCDLILHTSTPLLEYPRSDSPSTLRFVGPVLPEPQGTFVQPSWWSRLQESRPVIMLTQGTVSTNPSDLIRPAIEAMSEMDVFVVAVPSPKAESRGFRNIEAEPFIPFSELLPHVDLLVTNGGFGGVQQALARGVPVVVAGATEDKMEVGARIRWAKAGIHLRGKSPKPRQIRDAVARVLSSPEYRENASRIQEEFSKYHGPSVAADYLEQFVS